MSDWSAFLRSIIAAPDDDLPRLIAADWLDEHGQAARAEHIRVQCEIARTENYPDERFCERANGLLDVRARDCISAKCRPCWLRRRQTKLWRHHGCDWQGEIIRLVIEPAVRESLETGVPMNDHWSSAPRIGPVEFRRGFATELSCRWDVWHTHAAALLAACPIRRVNRPKECQECGGSGFRGPTPEDIPPIRERIGANGQIERFIEYRPPPLTPPPACYACHGTGKVDDWRGDGVVRLTDEPRLVYDARGRWFSLGGQHSIRQREGMDRPDYLRELLAAEWPGVRFELPQAEPFHMDINLQHFMDIGPVMPDPRSFIMPPV